MRAFVLAVLSAAVLQGCHHSSGIDPRTVATTTATGEIEGRPTLGLPTPIPGQQSLLIPFAVENTKGLFEDDDPYTRGGVDYDCSPRTSSISHQGAGFGGSVRWHNAIVRDLKTGEQWPILNRRGIIGQWQALTFQRRPDAPWETRAILFIAVLEDTNKDGLLDDRDSRQVILADADGRNARLVTAPDAQVWSTQFDAERDTLYLQVATDTNADGAFTRDDAALPHMLALASQDSASPIISGDLITRVRSLLSDPAAPQAFTSQPPPVPSQSAPPPHHPHAPSAATPPGSPRRSAAAPAADR
jgi:hypothetical protein